jgi:hypothetical protein
MLGKDGREGECQIISNLLPDFYILGLIAGCGEPKYFSNAAANESKV